MNLQYRISLLSKLGEYMLSADPEWLDAKTRASQKNGWFIPEFVDKAVQGIAEKFLQTDILQTWADSYQLPDNPTEVKNIGIVMAGNIPLVGFHDWLSVLVTGHKAVVKLSSKDDVLLPHLAEKLSEWNSSSDIQTEFAVMLKGCDAYIATGSNNSAGYFSYYFGRYPNIIRRNRTSAAILAGDETPIELNALADDVYSYFGLGCRNVTHLFAPENYDFVPLINAFRKYDYLADHHKYKNNYDYNLAINILNNKFYMSNDSLLLIEDPSLFSPIAQLNYSFYDNRDALISSLKERSDLQSLTGAGFVSFGKSQFPGVADYADGLDTVRFLSGLG